ncbi:hypothetical protein QA635_06410 [Bradyrhizobium brasilense]|uniref:DUF6998 domain-containing protein n=1 Tax=Bradyrhizobium brasilense TaxID=1419277 RepID=UPI0024B1E958|nr:hypothetical protein [Bradyrhizobium australafricanum]WFU34068.1 hypothetical protein QA635_06410 [Bradyrhizobium australafricanum]
MSQKQIKEALGLIFQGIGMLQTEFAHRQFTIDGRLVGDIGEIIAATEFDIELDDVSRAIHDGKMPDGRGVQIKATFQDHLTFKTIPDLYLGFKLFRDGTHEVIFNGPGRIIFDHYAGRAGIGEKLLRFPNTVLKRLSADIPDSSRVPKRLSVLA